MSTPRDGLYHATRRFMARDFRDDVLWLNNNLSKKNKPTANLRDDIPPIPFTGDPWAKARGDCTLFIGINPRFQDSTIPPNHREFGSSISSINRFHSGDDSGFEEFLSQRREYFTNGLKYGKHYTFPGKMFQKHWYDVENPWIQHVQSMDAVPWFSKTDEMDLDSLLDAYSSEEMFLAYRSVVEEVVELIQPKFIQLNGKKPRIIFEELYGIDEFQPMETIGKGCHSGGLNIGGNKIPVVAHNFSGTFSGLNGEKEWDTMYEEWTDS
ncbi:MAG: hypothetical protein ACPG87_06325 [Candidatus Thalassarchaeaceae archaeon]